MRRGAGHRGRPRAGATLATSSRGGDRTARDGDDGRTGWRHRYRGRGAGGGTAATKGPRRRPRGGALEKAQGEPLDRRQLAARWTPRGGRSQPQIIHYWS